jgi:hypothetical protein
MRVLYNLKWLIFRAELRKSCKAAGYAEEGGDANWLRHIGMAYQSPDWKIKWGRNAGKPTLHKKIMFGATQQSSVPFITHLGQGSACKTFVCALLWAYVGSEYKLCVSQDSRGAV